MKFGNISYALMNPAGNRTILVETAVPLENRAAIAAQLLRAEPDAEQVGFLKESAIADIRLQMAGGEFCGNATLSAAAWFLKNRLPNTKSAELLIEVTGADSPVPVSISRLQASSDFGENTCFTGTVSMPLPTKTEIVALKSLPEPVPVVFLPGIVHAIQSLPADESSFTVPGYCEATVRELCERTGSPAAGLMILRGETLTPVVYVASVNTLYAEHSCASGTAAVAARRFSQTQTPETLHFLEPGGTLTYRTEGNAGRLTGLYYTGRVIVER